MAVVDLSKKLEFSEIEWKIQSVKKNYQTKKAEYTIVVPYINKTTIVERLNKCVGPSNWSNELREWQENTNLDLKMEDLKFLYGEDYKGKNKIKSFIENIYSKKQICGISIKENDVWITKWDGADNTDIEGTKGGISNSLKRAANLWGIGLELNDFPMLKIEGEVKYINFEHINFFKDVYNTPYEKRSYSYTYSKNNKEIFKYGKIKKKTEKEELIDSINSMSTQEEKNRAINHYNVNTLEDLQIPDLAFIHDTITKQMQKVSKKNIEVLLEEANQIGQDVIKIIKKKYKKDNLEDLIIREYQSLRKEFEEFI